MLKRINLDKLGPVWERIKGDVQESLPPLIGQSDEALSLVYESVKKEEVILWAIFDPKQQKDALGLLLTSLVNNPFTRKTDLFIISFVSYEERNEIPSNIWTDVTEILFKHAAEFNCAKVFGFIKSQHLLNVLDDLGANTTYTYTYVPIEQQED